MARIQNNTGSFIPSIVVSYSFANPVAGVEEVPGWQAYYSITGNSNWIKIPEFSTATPGVLTANLNFGGTGWIRPIYFFILFTHVPLAATVPVLGTWTLVLGLKGRFDKHRRMARITFPIWVYVSVTGVLVYVLLLCRVSISAPPGAVWNL